MSAYRLPSIPYLRLRFALAAQGAAELPPFKGSTLRGAFGHALRRAVCAMGPQQPCPSCFLRGECVYPRLFETFLEEEAPPFLRGLPTAPRPYLFEPWDDRTRFPTGAELGFDLLLFGQAVRLQGHAILAVERMARTGLGSRRHPFELASVRAAGPDGTWRLLGRSGAREAAQPAPPLLLPPRELPQGAVALRFSTPTRLKVRGDLVARPDFRTLAFKMLRRTLELAYFHVPEAPLDWTFRPLLEAAGRVDADTSALEWVEIRRYSNRQQTDMLLGGFAGTLHLEGDLTPFRDLLRAAEILHVGKGTTFGLGKVEITAAVPRVRG